MAAKQLLLTAIRMYQYNRNTLNAIIIGISVCIQPFIGVSYVLIVALIKKYLEENNRLFDVYSKNGIVPTADKQYPVAYVEYVSQSPSVQEPPLGHPYYSLITLANRV